MKKTAILITAFITSLSLLTACEKDDTSSENKAESSQISTESSTDNTQPVSEVTTTAAQQETTVGELPDVTADMDDESAVKLTLEKFFKAMNDRDKSGELLLSGHDSAVLDRKMSEKGKRNGTKSIYDFVGEGEWYESSELEDHLDGRLVSIKSVKRIPDDDTYRERRGYLIGQWIEQYIEEHGGIDNTDPNQFFEDRIEYCQKMEVTEVEGLTAYSLDFVYTLGSEESYGYAHIYRVGDGNWGVNEVVFLDNNKEYLEDDAGSLRRMANDIASVVFYSEDDDYRKYEDAWYIISKDESLNYNVPESFDVEGFYERIIDAVMMPYYTDWFILFHETDAVLAVTAHDENHLVWGSDINVFDEKEEYQMIDYDVNGRYTYEELYNNCKELISR